MAATYIRMDGGQRLDYAEDICCLQSDKYVSFIDVNNVDPKNKNVKKTRCLWKNKKRVKKRWIKNVVDKLTTSRKPNEKNSPVKLLS